MLDSWQLLTLFMCHIRKVEDAPEEVSKKGRHAFKLLTPTKSFYVHCKTPASKANWMKQLQVNEDTSRLAPARLGVSRSGVLGRDSILFCCKAATFPGEE